MKCKVPPVSNRGLTKDESSLAICARLVVCRMVTTPFHKGLTGINCLFCVFALSVACNLSGSLIHEKRDTVLFENPSLWDVVRVDRPTRKACVL